MTPKRYRLRCIITKHPYGTDTRPVVLGKISRCICANCLAEAEIDSLRADLGHANNLLAIIHRDGGHHTRRVGFEQSCKDAETAVHNLRAEVSRLTAENEQLAKMHDQCHADNDAEVERLTRELAEARAVPEPRTK